MAGPLYVIPDIHGHKDKLDQALSLIRDEGGMDARIVFLGDYVDRGPDSCGVLQTLVDGIKAGHNWTLLRGNHDQLMLDTLAALPGYPVSGRHKLRWLHYNSGAIETLASYGLKPNNPTDTILKTIPASHLDLLKATRLWHQTKDLILAHAGIKPGVAMAKQTPKDLMWIREPFLSDRRDHGALVVHGHSPVAFPEHHGNRLALDGGAGWGRDLHIAVFEGRDCWLLDSTGRHPLTPD